MRIYDFMFEENRHMIEEVERTETNQIGVEPKGNATPNVIQSIYRFNVSAIDGHRHYDAEEISSKMIEMFKSSKCYEQKTDAERQEIIQYLKDHPDVDNPLLDI